jgi:hypothetical protein
VASLAWSAAQVLRTLASRSNPAALRGMARFGITAAKAFGWSTPALKRLAREIGKRNQRLNRAAIEAAQDIHELNPPGARWIASDALRELRSLAVQRRLQFKRAVIPAKAGIHSASFRKQAIDRLDSRFRGNDCTTI